MTLFSNKGAVDLKIGFVGQGYVGRSYADYFADRGFGVTRFSKEKPYIRNRNTISACDIVFIAVPTPTTSRGFDMSAVREALSLVSRGNIAVIKSTVLPGTTESLQKEFPRIFVMHNPEFLREKSAAEDIRHPERNIVGTPRNSKIFRRKAGEILRLLPPAPYEAIVTSREAELVKYAGNCFLYMKVVYANMLYDLSRSIGSRPGIVLEALGRDSRIGSGHLNPTEGNGRGAGGRCLIKDFAAFEAFYRRSLSDTMGSALLRSLSRKNIALLRESKKDLDLLRGVYGPRFNNR